ncbi:MULTISPECIES: hypothetical protein [Metabacillus]|uniref:Uncharacterized protein n=1 Tax=Metabacillus hrfriensis TaxID=3048891 RepID=A0ACD4RHI4_9BACI|nr:MULTISPECIES: hypothetical protein [Metabacillus]UAL54376.1 hypothetical protein K8L98_11635 [Metabacillus dongyingensis]UOK59628.1 hypothetical protein MGI18_13340 [Bacillus sp. OVS6]USK30693.1 hypothetical protein LIT32_11535 [Bacillus sp. CMF21]WHZ59943.1 hypothetical protein QLQ22_11660 [Metabacillus sp. CT-WN-B3]
MKMYTKVLFSAVIVSLILMAIFFTVITLYSLFTFQSFSLGDFYKLEITKEPASFNLEASEGMIYLFGITTLFFIILFSISQMIKSRMANANEK